MNPFFLPVKQQTDLLSAPNANTFLKDFFQLTMFPRTELQVMCS